MVEKDYDYEEPIFICGSPYSDNIDKAFRTLKTAKIEEIINPLEFQDNKCEDSLRAIILCKTVMVLPNWQYSEFSRLEMEAATLMGKYFIDEGMNLIDSPPKNILRKAEAVTRGDRNQDYGNAYGDYKCFGRLLAAYLTRYFQSIGFLEEHQDLPDICAPVAVVIPTLMKTSRHGHIWVKEDTSIDGAGYWSLVEMVLKKEAEIKLKLESEQNEK